MNSVQMHLALTHVPVILSLVGLIMLIVAFSKKNTTLIKSSYVLLLVSGVAAVPVFLTGEGAEKAVENLPGVMEAIIEKHEKMATLAMTSIAITGLLALAALISFRLGTARWFKLVMLLLAIAAGGLMMQTAHFGGQIRHTEIRNDATLQDGNKTSDESRGKVKQQEKDDD